MPGSIRRLHLIFESGEAGPGWLCFLFSPNADALPSHDLVDSVLIAIEAGGHGVEGERAEQVAAHALLHLDEGAGGRGDPVDAEALSQAGEFAFEVDIADELGRSGDHQEQIFNEAAEGAEQGDRKSTRLN